MNMTKYKRIIAREWLIFLIAIVVGIIFSVLLYFKVSLDYQYNRKSLYHSLKYEYKMNKLYSDIPELKSIVTKFKRDYHKNTGSYSFDDELTIATELAMKYPNKYEHLPQKIKNSDSLFIFIDYSEFSKIMDDRSGRKLFFDTVQTKRNLGNYEEFEDRYIQESFYSRLIRLKNHLISRWYWFNALFSILLPYLIFQILRSIYYSFKMLLKNKSTP